MWACKDVRHREHAAEELQPADPESRWRCGGGYVLIANLASVSGVVIARRGEDAEVDVEHHCLVRAQGAGLRMMIARCEDHPFDRFDVARGDRAQRGQCLAGEHRAFAFVLGAARNVDRIVKHECEEDHAWVLAWKVLQSVDARDDVIPAVIIPFWRLVRRACYVECSCVAAVGPLPRERGEPCGDHLRNQTTASRTTSGDHECGPSNSR